MSLTPIRIRNPGLQDYAETWQKMQDFTTSRVANTVDEIWIVQHPAVYTLGLNGKSEHVLRPGKIPVIRTDRGGQATYHGPGQLIMYPLLDIKRKAIGVRQLITALEVSTIRMLSQYGITAFSKKEAPGVYVAEKKIASVGIRVRRGCSYHGLSVNVGMNLSPFDDINICGFRNLKPTQLADLGGPLDCDEVSIPLVSYFVATLGYQWVK